MLGESGLAALDRARTLQLELSAKEASNAHLLAELDQARERVDAREAELDTIREHGDPGVEKRLAEAQRRVRALEEAMEGAMHQLRTSVAALDVKTGENVQLMQVACLAWLMRRPA